MRDSDTVIEVITLYTLDLFFDAGADRHASYGFLFFKDNTPISHATADIDMLHTVVTARYRYLAAAYHIAPPRATPPY